jgi:hypothetical protein
MVCAMSACRISLLNRAIHPLVRIKLRSVLRSAVASCLATSYLKSRNFCVITRLWMDIGSDDRLEAAGP